MSLLAVALCVVLRYRLPDAIACMLTIDFFCRSWPPSTYLENFSLHYSLCPFLFLKGRQPCQSATSSCIAWIFVDATSHHLLGILTNYVMISAMRALFLEEASSQIHGIDPLLPFLSLNLTYILYSKIE